MENKIKKSALGGSASGGNNGKILKGVVTSAKMKDTVVVSIDSFKKHPKYGKYIKKQNKIMAHDEGNTCKEGEIIEIIETRPISKNKKFKLFKKLKFS